MKVIGWIVGIVLVALIGIGVYVFLYSGDLVKRGIEAFGPDYLGADVSVATVDLDLAGGAAAIRGLVVGNPQGFDGPYAMRLGEIAAVLDTDSISSDVVVIRTLRVDGASLAAVARGKETNLQQLMDNLNAAAGTSEETEPAASTEPEMKFIVEDFAFTNADVSLTSDVLGDAQLTIPDIRLQGVGRKTNGVTAVELVQQLLRPITQAVTRAAVSRGVDLEGVKAKAIDKIKDRLGDQLGSGLKGLTDRLN